MEDSGLRDGGSHDGGGDTPADGGSQATDGGDEDAGVDPVCLRRQEEPMTFFTQSTVIEQDVHVFGRVVSVDRSALSVAEDDGGVRMLTWKLPSLVVPPIAVDDRIHLLYRPYSVETLQSASILIRSLGTGEVLFVGDTGLHHTRFSQAEVEVATIGVADHGCSPFLRCFETRNLDLVLTDDDGGIQRVFLGEKTTFYHRGRPYEAVNVNMAELGYLQCNRIPGRYRTYVLQRLKVLP